MNEVTTHQPQRQPANWEQVRGWSWCPPKVRWDSWTDRLRKMLRPDGLETLLYDTQHE